MVVIGQPMRAEEHGDRAVGIFMDAHARLDEVRSQAAGWDLEREPSPFDGVVVADLTLLLNTEDLAPGAGGVDDEGGGRQLGGNGEGGVVGCDVGLGEPAI